MKTSTAALFADIVGNSDIRFSIFNVASRTFPPGYTFGPHAHRHIEVDFVERGSCGMLFGTEYVRFVANECVLIFPEVSHYFFTPARVRCALVQVEFAVDNFPWMSVPPGNDDALSFLREIRTHSRSFLKFQPKATLAACMRNIREESKGAEPGREEMLKLLFSEFFIRLSREISSLFDGVEPPAAGKLRLRTLVEAIRNEFDGELSIEELAGRVGTSSRYLRREFHSAFGLSISDYIQELRLRKARKLLSSSDLSVLEVALECGYASSQYFARIFKYAVGLTPSDYRSLVTAAHRDPSPSA
jgi:AraC-like DNA-binding protein